METAPSLSKQQYIIFAVGGVVVLLLIIIILTVSSRQGTPEGAGPTPTMTAQQQVAEGAQPQGEQIRAGAIAKVGEEYIFQQDLTYELTEAGLENNSQNKKRVMTKLFNDSILLQAAAKNLGVTLNPNVYNTDTKNQAERISLVRSTENTVRQNLPKIEGQIVSIWFYNNMIVPPMGLEQAKQLTFTKISALQAQVKAGTMTMEQAAEEIKKDTSLEAIDSSYEVNALTPFSESASGEISIDPAFNTVLKNLPLNTVSDVKALKSVNAMTGAEYEALYAFGMVTAKSSGKIQANSIEDWIAEQKKNYPIQQY